MELIYLFIGIAAGTLLRWLAAARKTSELRTRIQLRKVVLPKCVQTEQRQAAATLEQQKQETQLARRQAEETNRLLIEARQKVATLQSEKQALEEKLESQKQEIAEIRKQFNLEFENVPTRDPAKDGKFQQVKCQKVYKAC